MGAVGTALDFQSNPVHETIEDGHGQGGIAEETAQASKLMLVTMAVERFGRRQQALRCGQQIARWLRPTIRTCAQQLAK